MTLNTTSGQTLPVSLPSEIVHTQLERILVSPRFASAPRLQRFLRHLVEQHLAGQDEQLKGYTLGIDVFDRSVDFDPQLDTIVRVQAGELRKRLELYYNEEGHEDPLLIKVPKGSYVPEFQVVFDPAAIDPANANIGSQEVDATVPTVAVLSFFNHQSGDKEKQLSDGLTEEVIAALSRFREIAVFSRWTTAELRPGLDTIKDLHQRVGADFILSGSLRQRGSDIRVMVELTDAAAQKVIYSDHFEESETNGGLFELQDRIATIVAGRVGNPDGPVGHTVLYSRSRWANQNPELFYWLSRYHNYQMVRSPEAHAQTRDGLLRVLAQDDRNGFVLAAASIILTDEYRYRLNPRPGIECRAQAMELARKAVEQAPELAQAHQALAMTHYYYGDQAKFEYVATAALDLNPGYAPLLAEMGKLYTLRGNLEKGSELAMRALELSPVHPGWYHFPLAVDLLIRSEPAQALAAMQLDRSEGVFAHHVLLAWCYIECDMIAEAQTEMKILQELYPNFFKDPRAELELHYMDPRLQVRLLGCLQRVGLNA